MIGNKETYETIDFGKSNEENNIALQRVD